MLKRIYSTRQSSDAGRFKVHVLSQEVTAAGLPVAGSNPQEEVVYDGPSYAVQQKVVAAFNSRMLTEPTEDQLAETAAQAAL